jgi:hypothetical protein
MPSWNDFVLKARIISGSPPISSASHCANPWRLSAVELDRGYQNRTGPIVPHERDQPAAVGLELRP